MADSHNKSFFGQNTGLIISSPSKQEDFIFLRCLKKNPNGAWEKPSKGEGKVIKLSLDEMVMILQVLNRNLLNWTSYHTYKDNKTSISFSWEDEKAKTLWVNIANYSKMFNFAQAEILRLIVTHILNEKIEFATTSNNGKANNKNQYKSEANVNNTQNGMVQIDNSQKESFFEEVYDEPEEFNQTAAQKPTFSSNNNNGNNKKKERSNIKGEIKGVTEKALLIDFNSGNDIWIPKSTVHSQFSPNKNISQEFVIDTWILKRNQIIS